ncbi:uncharacterized protein K452DRAFT_295474 [Aplosporella prunicola CBS 121167]|uniref:RING-type domain-containing protein n=1 Tax=Aplosporella prunicola CBS 121167 TaxID=1176127 RepID=A0A6A6BQN7_9PEZI|nr:uncharacterized protein K452DRAFT_295474 [Aplosporella prunicola CBS 121167]KAF2144901.1 hypothetical protein K452DRAFT_295474 [Aplosporella prunicola CBS 121167]
MADTSPSRAEFFRHGIEVLSPASLAPEDRTCGICLEQYGGGGDHDTNHDGDHADNSDSNGEGSSSNSNQDGEGEAPVRLKACGHVFGQECIKGWGEVGGRASSGAVRATCPLCRTVLFEDVAPPQDVIRARITHGDAVVEIVVYL